MVLKDILAISGESGLYKFIAQGKNAIIVEHIETGKRKSAFSSSRVSSLEDITVFTESEDLPLGKVFDRIYEKESGGLAIDSKTEVEKLRNYFEEVIPDYSKERVYASDIKKIVMWYNLLQRKNLLVKEEPEKKAEQENVEADPEKVASTEKKKKKSTSGQKKQRKLE